MRRLMFPIFEVPAPGCGPSIHIDDAAHATLLPRAVLCQDLQHCGRTTAAPASVWIPGVGGSDRRKATASFAGMDRPADPISEKRPHDYDPDSGFVERESKTDAGWQSWLLTDGEMGSGRMLLEGGREAA